MIPLGVGIYWAISGFDSRDQYLKDRLGAFEKAKDANNLPPTPEPIIKSREPERGAK